MDNTNDKIFFNFSYFALKLLGKGLSSTAETLEIPNLGFTALADKIHDWIALSGVDRFAADLFYSAHTAFPPMNGIAPYRPCR